MWSPAMMHCAEMMGSGESIKEKKSGGDGGDGEKKEEDRCGGG